MGSSRARMPTAAFVAGIIASTAVLAGAGPASAGGSWIYPERDRYEVGDEATMTGTLGSGQLGWLDDGPFFAYLRADPAAVEAAEPERWPHIDPTDVPLGEIRFEEQGHQFLQATVAFEVPDVAPGVYDVVYCNDPCTDGIGDLIGGTIAIGVDADRPLSPASQAEAQAEEERARAEELAALVAHRTTTTASGTGPEPEPQPERQVVEAELVAADDRITAEARPVAIAGSAGLLAIGGLTAGVATVVAIGRRRRTAAEG